MVQLEPLMRKNFLEYASYVVLDRAIPDVRDGLKPVQRRILHTLFRMDDGRFHKVANVIGEAMKLHPHGDAAIKDALVVLANKQYFIERQGNFGNPLTGHSAAAARYIECRLTPLARATLFNEPLTRFQPSYDGRRDEPIFLPAKLPVILMLGTDGIAVGMSTRILPHNPRELLEAEIALLKGRETRLVPDFAQGGLIDASDYQDGRGKVLVRARLERRGDKSVAITEIPFSTTTESVIASIETAAQKGLVKIGGISDFTTESVEIEVQLPRGVYADEVIPQLYAYTECQVSIASNLVVIADDKPAEMTVTQVLGYLTDRLLETIEAELKHELAQLHDKEHWLTLERIFIEERVYKRIEKAKTDAAVKKETWDGMHEHVKQFVRPMVDDDVDRLLALKIRRISAFDIEKHQHDFEEVRAGIKEREKKLANLKKTTIGYLESVLEEYGPDWERKTEITTFEKIERKDVARQSIKVAYDAESGFFGSKVKGDAYNLTISEYDRVLIVSNDGSFRVVGADDKILIPGKVMYCDVLDPEKGKTFTVVYRDSEKNCFGKRVHIQSFIRNREYELVPDKQGKVDLLLTEEKPGSLRLVFVPKKYQRVFESTFDLNSLELAGVSTRGTRLAPQPVQKVQRVEG